MGSHAWTHLRRMAVIFAFTVACSAFGQSAATSKPASQPASKPAASAPAAAATATPAAAAAAPQNPVAKAIKNPVPWFSWGFDERVRNEYLMNAALNYRAPGHDTDYNRYRTRLWWTVKPIDDIEFNFRLVWEFRNYFSPEGAAHLPFSPSDALFDALNIKWKNVAGLPLTVTAGRQDIILGNGWWMLDGTPLDGSRTIFFDGFRATYEMKDIQTTIDGMYVWQNVREDQYITPFGYDKTGLDKSPILTEQDENGFVLYVTNKSIKNTEINGYFIYKDDSHPVINPLTRSRVGDSGQVYAFGNRIVHDFNKNWQIRGEWMEEVGNKNAEQFSAGGINTRLTYFFRDKMDNQLRTGYEFLSDKFDPLWGRWPQWSELMPFIWAMETRGRPAYWQNLHRIQFGHTITPIPRLDLCTDYHLLFADANTQKDTVGFSDEGRFRGQLITWLAKYKINEFFSTHFIAEFFVPGDYYTREKNDTAAFLRYELVFTF